MVIRALQVGYATVLRDVRDGDLDTEIRERRPDL